MKKLQIKSRKDWFIACFIAFLFIYLIVLRFQVKVSEYLLPLTPDRISYFNQPEQQGVLAVTTFIMTALLIGVMIYKKVRGRYLALTLIGGVVTTAVIMGSYYYQCQLILKVPSECEPEAVSAHYFDERSHSFVDYTLDEKTKKQIVGKVLALQPVSGEKTERPKDRDGSNGNGSVSSSGGETSVSIWYPLKSGYSYLIDVTIKDNEIRIRKGQNPDSDPLYRDNGLLELLEKIKNDQPNLLPGVYKFQESDDPVKPNVVLKAHNQFVFTYSSLSSYLAIGTYMTNNNNLVLETNDGKYRYVFEIKNNTLIFNKEESSPISLGDLRDGSIFVIQEE